MIETKSLTSQPFASQPANPPASHSPANPPAANPPASRPGALCSLQGKPSFFIDSVPDPVRTFGNRSSGRACFATSQTKYCYFCCAGPRPWCFYVCRFTRLFCNKSNEILLFCPCQLSPPTVLIVIFCNKSTEDVFDYIFNVLKSIFNLFQHFSKNLGPSDLNSILGLSAGFPAHFVT